jgi:hypothetical protein
MSTKTANDDLVAIVVEKAQDLDGLAKRVEGLVQVLKRTQTALQYAKSKLEMHKDHISLEYIRRMEAGEFEGG